MGHAALERCDKISGEKRKFKKHIYINILCFMYIAQKQNKLYHIKYINIINT